MADQDQQSEPVAVVGMALRVPGANTVERFWQNILEGRDSLTRMTTDQLRSIGTSQRDLNNPDFVRAAPRVDDYDYFDASFFGLTDYEAERTDPAHRLFMECAWEAMETAGIPPGRNGPVTGVFGGPEGSYLDAQLEHLKDKAVPGSMRLTDRGKALPLQIGNTADFFSTRVSHKFDLTGASLSLLGACATSLLALHLAVQSIRRRECEIAIVGGASISVPHAGGYLSSVEGMLSPTGRIRPFDADADGTVFGSGVGAVVVRPLSDAIADGNPIWGIVRGSGMSNDGNPPGKESFVAPSREGQIAAVDAAMRDAGVSPESIGYLEAHGTATLLGDPVEVNSIAEIYRRETGARQYCGLGSVKGNVGHLRMAAGVISLIKACLALKHETLPPVANFTRHNPLIDFKTSPFFISDRATDWIAGDQPRRAAVSSFGFGGVNAHAVVEEYEETESQPSARNYHLIPISAKSEAALSRRISDLATYISGHPDVANADLAYSLQHGRADLAQRAFVCTDDAASTTLMELHTAELSGSAISAKSSDRPVVFLFPGQGAQQPGMGLDIYEQEPLYRDVVDRCAARLEPELGFDIRTVIHTGPDDDADLLRQTANAQPALFVVGYALAQLFLSWGVKPVSMLGHSIGEIVAACVAGVFSLDDALSLVAARARLMQSCEPGAMAGVFLSGDQLTDAIADHRLEIAAFNAPKISIVSGSETDIESFLGKMEQAGTGTRRVETSHAFHSRMMDPVLPAIAELLRSIKLNGPAVPVISNRTGAPLSSEQATNPDYWADHLRHTVRFSEGVEYLLADSDPVFLELGPGRTLCHLVRQHHQDADAFAVLSERQADTRVDGGHTALNALGRLWCAGGTVDWKAGYRGEKRRILPLPTYPFERRRYWLDAGDTETRSNEKLHLYEPGWRLSDRPQKQLEDDGRPWLIFRDDQGIGAGIAAKIRERGCTVWMLSQGDRFARLEDFSFTVRPGVKDDLASVLSSVRSHDDGLPPRVLHLWSVTGQGGDHNTADAFQKANRAGFYTLAALVTAAASAGASEGMEIFAIGDGLKQIDGEAGDLHAEKGGLLGPVHTLPLEFSLLSCRLIDITGFDDSDSVDSICKSVIAEAECSSDDKVVCLRPGGRYVEELYEYGAPKAGRPFLRDGGTVLITGAMGGLGLAVAGALFHDCRARLVLLSRWEPPPRDQWHERAAVNDKIGHALRALIELEDQGAEICVICADTGHLQSLRAAVDSTESKFGAINGVVHAAGINTDGPITEMDPDAIEAAFRAKVHGAFHLEEIFAGKPLDFFVCFSSQATQKPSRGQAAYSASNSILDIFAQRRQRRQNGLTCAIGWGPWEEFGMAVAGAESKMRENHRQTRRSDQKRQVERRVDHPLIHYRYKTEGESVVYGSMIRDGDHWVCEHRFKDRALLAGVTILECLRASFSDMHDEEYPVELSSVAFVRPLFIDVHGTDIEFRFIPDGERFRFEVRSRKHAAASEWTLNTLGHARKLEQKPEALEVEPFPDAIPDATDPYNPMPGFGFGARWDCLPGIHIDGNLMWTRAQLGDSFIADGDNFGIHPATFDRALGEPHKVGVTPRVPFSIDRIRLFGKLGEQFMSKTQRHGPDFEGPYDSWHMAQDGRVLIHVEGLIVRKVEGSRLVSSALADENEPSAKGGLSRNELIRVTRIGDMDSVCQETIKLSGPGPGEVAIDVVAAGLNFKDVLATLGQIANDDGALPRIGSECSGIVSDVGSDVTGIRPGDRVVALVHSAFAGSAIAPVELVMPVPDRISMEEAAGIPITFLTADYAINSLAGLAKHERILIHAAAGGVGLAAVQMAQQIGAEIFATAGHADKREYLRSLGIKHVMDSRTLEFADEIRAATNGEGVDVILNSLAGEYITTGLDLLRYRGRFVEIGKRDILDDTKIGLAPFGNNLSYHAVDLGPMIERRDPALAQLFDSLMLRFSCRDLEPSPTSVYPIQDIAKAMQHMARAEHIGKIVLKVGDDPNTWRSLQWKFRSMFGRGIPVMDGLEIFRRLTSSSACPHYVMVTGQSLEEIGIAERRIGKRASTRPNLATDYRAAATEDETKLVKIWERALGVNPIGVDDDFFDLGGDSIAAIQTQFSVADEFGINLSTGTFFDYPTVASLAAFIMEQDKTHAIQSAGNGLDPERMATT